MKLGKVTPSVLIDPKLVGMYLAWRTKRSGESGTHRNYLKYARMLTHPRTGFMAQCPEFICDLLAVERASIVGPENGAAYRAVKARWSDQCADLHDIFKDIRDGVDNDVMGRDPQADLAPILNLKDPMSVIIEIINNYRNARPARRLQPRGDGQQSLALWYRNDLLVRLIVSNPLRLGNLGKMIWKSDQSGNLYRNKSQYRIRFNPADFKNSKGAARK